MRYLYSGVSQCHALPVKVAIGSIKKTYFRQMLALRARWGLQLIPRERIIEEIRKAAAIQTPRYIRSLWPSILSNLRLDLD